MKSMEHTASCLQITSNNGVAYYPHSKPQTVVIGKAWDKYPEPNLVTLWISLHNFEENSGTKLTLPHSLFPLFPMLF